ncbi:MAG: type Z 30S ribosomal protein S14 [Patescibacteria group bacterium]
MAKLSLKIKTERRKVLSTKQFLEGKKITFPTRVYNRCRKCGRVGGYMRKFALCRICFRELAREGKVMGVKKSSW